MKLLGIEAARIYAVVWSFGRDRRGQEQKMFSIRQKCGPTLAASAQTRVAAHLYRRCSSRCGYAQNLTLQPARWREQNHPILIPRSTASRRRIRQHLHCAVGQIDPFQFAVGEESKRFSIRRPKRKVGAFRARQTSRIVRPNLIGPDESFFRSFLMGCYRHRVAVRPHRHVANWKWQRRRKYHATFWLTALAPPHRAG